MTFALVLTDMGEPALQAPQHPTVSPVATAPTPPSQAVAVITPPMFRSIVDRWRRIRRRIETVILPSTIVYPRQDPRYRLQLLALHPHTLTIPVAESKSH